MTKDRAVTITGRDNIERARWLAVRSALSLETKGLKRSRRPSARQLANDITGSNARTAVKAYAALDDKIASELGEQFRRPLKG